mmetsp:Transcript_30530/g.59638  ORF Transcript_30530/g.59638 Transcript_30530/m.59638 type:complete len:350 (-) Transcript_30530:439-1488(-)|eukprot:CAMPEP_0173415314 /NCGR_PEP_ID=MMETSP1356-20130122/84789_1 /TAXON_ID=77927 ORGANISM="Hemiselmis virescens, Strain PCC157" /NCGR_SAMPLE_ID=MMETSP1356 /ASSEMBLY_ACC=CAM_ASM_000847 /LENGTH=349 /DNA_ID=CAMNT_0014377553 /DNA_START=257 /DNA_END=1306 /DNA_ORIENTATION=+
MATTRPIDLQELSKYFKMPEKAVAKSLGICLTSLKKICRAHGVTRWPYRKIKSLDKKLKKLEVAMSTAKDDPGMVYAKWGGGNCEGEASCTSSSSSDKSSSYSGSPTPSSQFASMASTPRQSAAPLGHGHSSPPSPVQLVDGSVAPHYQHAPPLATFATAEACAVKDEHAATGVLHPIAIFSDDAGRPAAPAVAMQAVAVGAGHDSSFHVIKMEEGDHDDHSFAHHDEYERSPSPDVSDEDLIAMLASCAGTDGAGSSAAAELQHSATASHVATLGNLSVSPPMSGSGEQKKMLSDDEIMDALAGCCSFPCGMEDDVFSADMTLSDEHVSDDQSHNVYNVLCAGEDLRH